MMLNMPNLPEDADTPCMNAEVAGRRLENGRVVDLWFGESGSMRHVKEAVQEAAHLCLTQCQLTQPDAFAACHAFFHRERPAWGVWAGESNEFDLVAMLDDEATD